MENQAQEELASRLRAVVLEAKRNSPTSLPVGEEDAALFASAGAIEPPYDQLGLCLLMEHSGSLRPDIDAYATNIDASGYRFENVVDLTADDAADVVAENLYIERLLAKERGDVAFEDKNLHPTSDAVTERLNALRIQSRVEKSRLRTFFDYCCYDHSFVELRKRTRQDLELTGNAYWEILRDAAGRISRICQVQSHTVRLLPLDNEPTQVTEAVRTSDLSFEETSYWRCLRRYVQLQGGRCVYFKQFGDPRSISRTNGTLVTEGSPKLANELLHFSIHSPRTPYGVPRWIGTLLSVLGSRQMEEVNYSYFNNKSVPPLALLVSGGRLTESSIPRIQDFIEENIRGKDNFHKILILEAEGGGDGKAKIELKALTEAQQQDALFQVYDERNMDKIGGAFRLPRLLRGESKDFNRSVADAQLRFAEDQVFQPEREEFDYVINRKLLGDSMGICLWRLRSQAPSTRDPERMTAIVEKLVRVGVITPEEGRSLTADILNRELRKIDEAWVKRPIVLTLAGIQTGSEAVDAQRNNKALLGVADHVAQLHETLRAEEESLAKRRMDSVRQYVRDTQDESITESSDEP